MSETSDDTGAAGAPPDETARDEAAPAGGDGTSETEPARPDVDPGILAAAAEAVAAASGGDAAPADGEAWVDAPSRGGGAAAESDVRSPDVAVPDVTAPDVTAPDVTAPDGGPRDDAPRDDATPEEAPPVSVDVADPDAESLAQIPLPVRIEAALFAATEPLPLKRLKEITGCPDGRLLRDTLDVLAASYAEHGRAFRVEEVAQGFQLRTSADVAVVVQRLGRRAADEKLSTAALETLAVVAYRQPVLRADIERIRGVACGEVLRALQERGLVRAAGRADLPGSPILYGTTHRFLEIFGLRDIQDLPKDREVLRRPD